MLMFLLLYAGPSGAGDITVIEKTTTTIDVNWLPAQGNLDSYRVSVTSESGLPKVCPQPISV